MWPGAAGPCSSGSRCFMGISFGLVLVEGLPAAGWATWVDCAPSVERGGGGNGWADGLTGGALRAGPESPTKTSGEICCLEQCRPDAESSGPFSSGVGQRCRGGPQSNGNHALHQQGLPPGGGLRWGPRLSAVLGRPHGGSGERRHDGSHRLARTWGEVRRWCQVRTSALVTLGVGSQGYGPGAIVGLKAALRQNWSQCFSVPERSRWSGRRSRMGCPPETCFAGWSAMLEGSGNSEE